MSLIPLEARVDPRNSPAHPAPLSPEHRYIMFRSLSVLASLALVGGLNAQSWDQHLTPGTTDARLPSGLGVTDTVIAFGQPRFDPYANPLIEDIVRVFELQGADFVEVAALQSSLVPATSASYGVALDVEGDLLAVGDPAAPGVGFTSGAVHLYRRGVSGWALEQVLQPTVVTGISVLEFGVTLDIANGRLVVGAPTSTVFTNGLEDGAVYVFEQIAGVWSEVQRLEPPNTSMFGHFGRDLELDGDRLIIGHPGGDPTVGPGGLAYILDHDGSSFVQSGMLAPSVPALSNDFGRSVAISGSTAAVGSPGVSFANFQDGEARIFEESGGTWSETAILDDITARPYNRFGSNLEIEGGDVFITSENTASAQRFEKDNSGWHSVERYTTEAGFTWAPVVPVRMRSVAGRVVLTDAEGVTVFQRDVPATLEINCLGTPLPNGVPSIPDRPVVLDTRGELSFSEPEVPFLAVHGTFIGPGVLFYGFNSASIPFAGGSELCVAPPVARAGVGLPTTGSNFSPVTLDLQSFPVANGPQSFGPGTTVYFQYWFRVPGGGSFLSSSLETAFAP